MEKRDQLIKFGEDVEGYSIPVLNEREIRAAAGLMFLALFMSLMLILFEQDFMLVKYVIIVFLTDFIIRVFISPRFAPVLIIGRLVVSNQVPEYVGAAPKKFAWKIGLALASGMFLLLVVLNTYSTISAVTCFVCLLFLFCESAFGICVGCWMHGLFYKHEAMLCPGETCKEVKKQAIQQTSRVQLLIVLGCIIYLILAMVLFNEYLREAPGSLREVVRY
ncbi:MAG: DUF4395 domain-containing protein [Chitinophagaceae bacterium]